MCPYASGSCASPHSSIADRRPGWPGCSSARSGTGLGFGSAFDHLVSSARGPCSRRADKTVCLCVCSRDDDRLATKRLVLCLVPSRSGAHDRLVFHLVPSKRAFTRSLSPFGRGASPESLAIPLRLQLAELSQLAQSSSGLLAQPACAHVRTRYAESSGLGVALRTLVVLGHLRVHL